MSAGTASAHPLILARAAGEFQPDGKYKLAVQCDVAALVMQSGTGHLDDILAAEMGAMPRDDLQARVEDALLLLKQQLKLEFDGKHVPPESIKLPTPEQLQSGQVPGTAPEATIMEFHGQAPAGAKSFVVNFPRDMGTVVLSLRRAGHPIMTQTLNGGGGSFPFSLVATGKGESVAGPSRLHTAWTFLVLGFEHILPKGLDHILFVLGLFLLSPKLTPLLWQVTAFTIAHSVTLALSMAHVVSLPPSVVEPLIAASIAFVALENVFTTQLQPWRPAVVFGFGLLHGLGFAGVLAELGLPEGEFVVPLVAFNVGVELGQIAVILLAFAAVGAFRNRAWYRSRITIPASCGIALMGIYWTVERILEG